MMLRKFYINFEAYRKSTFGKESEKTKTQGELHFQQVQEFISPQKYFGFRQT